MRFSWILLAALTIAPTGYAQTSVLGGLQSGKAGKPPVASASITDAIGKSDDRNHKHPSI